jgi:hypothetical protein
MRRRPILTPAEFAASLGSGLSEPEAMLRVTTKGIGAAPLPPLYLAAEGALRACLAAKSPADFATSYDAARAALAACVADDECAAWPKASALASYAHQADSETLVRLVRLVSRRVPGVVMKLLADDSSVKNPEAA